jgi:hypothetical protein
MEIIRLYRQWSEDFYAAGFLIPCEETVREFREWLRLKPSREAERALEPYEAEMLAEYHRQEREEQSAEGARTENQAGAPMSDFVICINNERNRASLILGKVYRVLPDAKAKEHNMLRVLDEDRSEPDGYLYPASMFAPIKLPEATKRALIALGP